MTHPFLDRLAAGPILADGAVGTMLYAAGASLDESFDALNLSRPDLVLGMHRAYLDAGAELLETNSFGANRCKLEGFGHAGRVREINRKAVRLAREAREIAGKAAFVAGSVGPLGRTLAPFGTLSPAAARAAFREQIEALLEGGVDLLVLETIGSLDEMTEAVLRGKGRLRPAHCRLDDLRRGRPHHRRRHAARGRRALAGAGRVRHWR